MKTAGIICLLLIFSSVAYLACSGAGAGAEIQEGGKCLAENSAELPSIFFAFI